MSYSMKGSRKDPSRASRPRKRQFRGNQFVQEDVEESGSAERSASAKKIDISNSEDVCYDPLLSYRLIEFFTVFTGLAEILICHECKNRVKFQEGGSRGFGFKIVVVCQCGRKEINSGPYVNNGYEINRRMVFVMRLLGIAREGVNLFANLMDICDGLSSHAYDRIVRHLHSASQTVFESCCRKAVDEERKENEKHERPMNDFKVSGDGSWKKRGFKSLYGVTTLIGYYSGKVVDLIVKSSYCQACTSWKNKQNTEKYDEWYEEHVEECSNNHEGSSGKMEVSAVTEMFLRSEEKYGVKYGNYIGDGDSKTYKAILDVEPYGEEFPVTKSECVGHVERRMGTRSRNIKKINKLGGRGKLTETLIKKLQTYYGLAIRRNVNSVNDMKNAIMATYYHLCSTDENPKHELCPKGEDSWCKWNKAEALGDDPAKHPQPLHPDVQKHLLPIFQDLSNDYLLQRCLGGHTQNANESFNSTIWRLSPKHLNCGLKIVEISAYIAGSLFNEGFSSLLHIMQEFGLTIGKQAKNFAINSDRQRIERQERRSSLATKEAHKSRREQMDDQNDYYEEAEGLFYGAGIAD